MAILTEEYEIEICVINTECGGRIDYFGEDRHFPYRVFLLYNNLHYDPGKCTVRSKMYGARGQAVARIVYDRTRQIPSAILADALSHLD